MQPSQQQQPAAAASSIASSTASGRVIRISNPLLSAAGPGFDFPGQGLIMPVVQAPPPPPQQPPIQDAPVVPPAAELDSFLGQAPPPSQQVPSPPHQQAPPPTQQQQPKQQSYFTSILSSLPNLSLSSITGEDRTQQQQQQQQQPQQQQSYGIYGAPTAPHPPNPYEYNLQQQQQSASDFNAGILQSPPQQQQQLPPPQPPPTALPPSGGAASYRLGNQRRLKYAPPPELTSANLPKTLPFQQPPPSQFPSFPSSQQPQPPPHTSSFPSPQPHQQPPPANANLPPNLFNPNAHQILNPRLDSSPDQQKPPAGTSIPSNLFNPNAHQILNPRLDSSPNPQQQQQPPSPPQQQQQQQQQQAPPPQTFNSGPVTPLSASQSSSFRNSPIQQTPPRAFPTPPQSIPIAASRLLEPATPQNTPADVAFSGFNAYRQQQQQQQQATPFSHYNSDVISNKNNTIPVVQSQQLEVIKESSSSDKTFTPISAARVTEKLESFIAEQNDDSLSVKSELSAEVATITANIPQQQQQQQQQERSNDITDELTEIDLSASASSDVPNDNIAPPTTSFFAVNQERQEQQSVPSFYDTSSFCAQDPFAFVQSTQVGNITTDSVSSNFLGDASASLAGPPIKQFEQSANPTSAGGGDVGFMPQSIWGSSQSQGHSAVLNPVYGSPTQSAPTFFNPAQFNTISAPAAFPTAPPPAAAALPISDPYASILGNQHQQRSFNANIPEPTGSATLSPVQMSISPLTGRPPMQETVPPSLQNLASGIQEKQMQYRPAYHHWFYRREVETKTLWLPFSMHDSLNLEEIHNSNEISPETKVATDGGRYDVEILRRQRSPVYWTGPTTEVRRCSWFYKGQAESRYTPYEESVAARLEEEYKQACANSNWNRRVDLNNGEYIVFHSPSVQVHYLQATTPELAASWGNNSGSEDNAYLQGATTRPRVVKRGMDEFNIDDGEPERCDHLLFLVHGIGSVCDLKFRTVEEVVDEFRSISLQLVQSHYRSSSEQGIVNRIEVLPISWHATLHSGIDRKLRAITLESIPKLRHFTNDTLLDILFYTSPIYCETIMKTVGNEMNRLYELFRQRNPEFGGNVYLGGHSLGSLILFDLLCHQKPPASPVNEEVENVEANGQVEKNEERSNEEDVTKLNPLPAPVLKRRLSRRISYVMGNAGTGQPFINYPQLAFQPRAFFALGSPIGMFVTVRGIDTLGEDFVLPTCPAFFNIFHPFDPVAYRVEALINPEAHKYRPMLIPHHKGRKRMHLELKETMARVGADLKQKLLDSVRSTWNSVFQLAMFQKQDNQTLEQEIEKVVEEQMNNPPTDPMQSHAHDDAGADLKIGKLNGGRRIDYVLQEAPFEYINEYIFALTSHVGYWESEDTMLLMLKEIYGSMGIQTDAQLPQQSLSIERVSTPTLSACPSSLTSPTSSTTTPTMGMDPTAAILTKPIGPPPTVGFVRKS